MLDFPRWTLEMRGRGARAHLEMTGSPESMVCLGYDNPARARSYCLNSKTARVRIDVEPADGPAFTLTSEHGERWSSCAPTRCAAVQPVV